MYRWLLFAVAWVFPGTCLGWSKYFRLNQDSNKVPAEKLLQCARKFNGQQHYDLRVKTDGTTCESMTGEWMTSPVYDSNFVYMHQTRSDGNNVPLQPSNRKGYCQTLFYTPDIMKEGYAVHVDFMISPYVLIMFYSSDWQSSSIALQFGFGSGQYTAQGMRDAKWGDKIFFNSFSSLVNDQDKISVTLKIVGPSKCQLLSNGESFEFDTGVPFHVASTFFQFETQSEDCQRNHLVKLRFDT